jgi:hypothetical protein
MNRKKIVKSLKANGSGLFFRGLNFAIIFMFTRSVLDIYRGISNDASAATNIFISINVWGALTVGWLMFIGSLVFYNYILPWKDIDEKTS